MRHNLRALAVAAAVATTCPALAETGESFVVHYADLNLASPAGAAALKGRLHRAVQAVCPDGGSNDLTLLMEVNVCRAHARVMADRQFAAVVDKAQRLAARGEPTVLASR